MARHSKADLLRVLQSVAKDSDRDRENLRNFLTNSEKVAAYVESAKIEQVQFLKDTSENLIMEFRRTISTATAAIEKLFDEVIGEEKNKQAYIRNMMHDMEQADLIETNVTDYTVPKAPKIVGLKSRPVAILSKPVEEDGNENQTEKSA